MGGKSFSQYCESLSTSRRQRWIWRNLYFGRNFKETSIIVKSPVEIPKIEEEKLSDISSQEGFVTENEDINGKSDINEVSFSHPESVQPFSSKSKFQVYDPSLNALFQRSKSGNLGTVNKLTIETDNTSSVQGEISHSKFNSIFNTNWNESNSKFEKKIEYIRFSKFW